MVSEHAWGSTIARRARKVVPLSMRSQRWDCVCSGGEGTRIMFGAFAQMRHNPCEDLTATSRRRSPVTLTARLRGYQ